MLLILVWHTNSQLYINPKLSPNLCSPTSYQHFTKTTFLYSTRTPINFSLQNKTMNWTRGHTIGRGSSATVFAATSSDSGELFAVKSAELSKSELLQREQRILSTLNSPFVVGYRGFDVTEENGTMMFNLMLEFMPEGTLLDGIRSSGTGEAAIGYYTKQIVKGIAYLHSKGIVHCDIKSRNVLLGESGAKIADFGCSKLAGDRRRAAGGTPAFMSPEVAQGQEQSFPADIWALGCTVLEMFTGGASPWRGGDAAEILYRIAYSGESPAIPDSLSDQAKDFLQKCLKQSPEDRYTAEELLNHQFLRETPNIMAKQSQEIDTNSPTSVLDQGIWNTSTPRSLDSPSERVLKLCSVSPENQEWDQESWTTVRGGGDKDCGSVTALRSNGVAVDRCRVFIGDKSSLNCAVDCNVSCSSLGGCSAGNGTEQFGVITANLSFQRFEHNSVKQLHFL